MVSFSKLIRPAAAVATAGLLAFAAVPAQAVTIVATFDSSVTSQANASAIESAFNAVAHDYAVSFANPVTVNVTVSWGSVAGQALPSNAVGASADNLYGYFSYAQIRAALAASAASDPTDTALATALTNMPAVGPSGVSQYAVASAEAKALGFIPGDQAGPDGYIGFAGQPSGYDFNPADGVAVGTYDFEGVAAHELAEVLGRISGLYNTTPTYRTPFDLFRYKSAHNLDFRYADQAYFSINGGVKKLANFNASRSGGDRGDWTVAVGSTDAQGAFISTGRAYNISNVDLTALDVLGWTGTNTGNTKASSPAGTAFAVDARSVPEPATWAMLILGFGAVGATLRRRALALA